MTEEWRDDFRKQYKKAYEGIFPDEVLESGNEWFEDFISQQRKEAAREALEAALALIDEHDPSVNRETSPEYWGNTLRVSITKHIEEL